MEEKIRLNTFFDWYYNDLADLSPGKAMPIYSALEYFIHRKLMERLMLTHIINQGIETLSDKKIADIGCGDGSRFRPFIEWGVQPANVYAIDISERVLSRARATSPAAVNFICGFGDDIPLEDNSIDIVLNMGVIIHVLDDELVGRMAAEFYRLLKPGGILFLYYTSDRVIMDGSPIIHGSRGFKRQQVIDLFSQFEIVSIHTGFVDDHNIFQYENKPIFPYHIGKIEDALAFGEHSMLHEMIVYKKPI